MSTVRLWCSGYSLRARARLSGLGENLERCGTLLRIETPDGFGYADIHPWVELGDAPIEKQILFLAAGQPTRLGSRSLALAKLDADIRATGKSAFENLKPPPLSHRLININDLTSEFLGKTQDQGFQMLKIKLNGDLQINLHLLYQHALKLSGFRLRFDANAQLTVRDYSEFCEKFPITLRERVEFIEDPISPNDGENWMKLMKTSPFSLAIDRIDDSNLENVSAPWVILKPAVQTPAAVCDWARRTGARIAVTSYLDHPVGQVGAALAAAQLSSGEENLKMVGACGLNSHLSYEANAFSEALPSSGPEFYPPEGSGIGFDELLKRLPWEDIS